MIITIKGADFSAKNIGTLSTWTILTNLGSGATYSGNRFVDKDSSLSATITIAAGYELGSAGVSVIMGVTDITSGATTVNGNTITISITKVTSNVTISVSTINTSSGEEDDGEEPDELAGTWLMNETVDVTNFGGTRGADMGYSKVTLYKGYKVNYIAGSEVSELFLTHTSAPGILGIAINDNQAVSFLYNEGKWSKPGYQTLVITSKLSEVEGGGGGASLLAWMKTNGTKIA